MIDASWVIERRDTGKPVLETLNFELVQFVNLRAYRVWTIHAWLVEVNRRIRVGGPSVNAKRNLGGHMAGP